MKNGRTGFAVVYQWRVKTGHETQFCEAWEALTKLLTARRGAHGSRLHRTDQGTFVAYAQWPSQSAWEQSCALHKLDEGLSKQMLDVVEETWPPMFLTTVNDQLIVSNEKISGSHVTTH